MPNWHVSSCQNWQIVVKIPLEHIEDPMYIVQTMNPSRPPESRFEKGRKRPKTMSEVRLKSPICMQTAPVRASLLYYSEDFTLESVYNVTAYINEIVERAAYMPKKRFFEVRDYTKFHGIFDDSLFSHLFALLQPVINIIVK